MRYNVGDKFTFEGVEYMAVEFNPESGLKQCECCDLNMGGRKRCLNNNCDCGNCDQYTGNPLVFKSNLTPSERRKIIEIGLRDRIARLTEYNESLNNQLDSLKKENRELKAKISKFKAQMKHLYGHINVAIKKEIYKNLE